MHDQDIEEFAPICLFVYNRVNSVVNCIESLQKNKYFHDSPFFIFSDGPKSKSKNRDHEKVEKVRNFIHSKEWTKNTIIIESEENKGLANSIIFGVSHVLKYYENVIVLEDDLIFSTDFLCYINEGLVILKDRNEIFSISGYIFPIKIPSNYKHQILALPAVSSYGWATWKNRWDLAEWDLDKFYSKVMSDKATNKQFKIAGEQMISLLKKQHYNLIDSWAIRWYYTLNSNNGLTIFPTKCKAIQSDSVSSKTHKTNRHRMNLELSESPVVIEKNINVDDRILIELQSFFKTDIIRNIYYYLLFKKNQLFK